MKCWICERDEADSREHRLLKAALDRMVGKPVGDEKRFIHYVGGKQNIPVRSFKNPHFKFARSLCQRCNNQLTQPYDEAFNRFVEKLCQSEKLIIVRNRLAIARSSKINVDNLALYFCKIFGCLVVDNEVRINERDYQLLRNSLLQGNVLIDRLFGSFHRDLAKQSAKKGKTVADYPIFERDFIAWTIDLDWISMTLTYPFPPPAKYGDSWQFGRDFVSVKLGKLY